MFLVVVKNSWSFISNNDSWS